MADTCPVCVKLVLDSEEGFECDGACKRWFHRECAKITKTEYKRITSDNCNKWYCSRSDCIDPTNLPMSTMSAQLTSVISKLDVLLMKVNTIDNISKDIADIKSDISSINLKVSALEPRVAEVESKLDSMTSEVEFLNSKISSQSNVIESLSKQNKNQLNPDDLIKELNQRASCKFNILVHGLPESISTNAADSKKEDESKIRLLVSTLCPEVETASIKLFRLGPPGRDKVRPIKIIFKNECDARSVIGKFSNEIVSAIGEDFSSVGLTRDKTVAERKCLEDLRKELETRTKNGEKNLTIKYSYGVPAITKVKPRNP